MPAKTEKLCLCLVSEDGHRVSNYISHVRETMGDENAWLTDALFTLWSSDGSSAEDLKALEHFVFHRRRNGNSNVCLVCLGSTGFPNAPHEGHDKKCLFKLAYESCKSWP